MAFGDKFKRAPAKSAPATGGKRRSKYGGVKANEPRDPMPHIGLYRFRVLACEEGHNPGKGADSFKTHLEIVDLDEVAAKNHEKGDTVFMPQRVGGNGSASGLARVKSFVMGAAGYDDEDEYDAFDPSGEFIDAQVGNRNDYSEAGLTIIGRLVDCEVTRGNATADGADYYREYAWAPVEDEGQTKIVVPA